MKNLNSEESEEFNQKQFEEDEREKRKTKKSIFGANEKEVQKSKESENGCQIF